MIKFIKKHMPLFVKFWGNQIVLSFLGLFLGLGCLAMKESSLATLLNVCALIFSTLFLCYMQYDNTFQRGQKDFISYGVSGQKPDLLLGAKIACIGYLPTVLIIVLGILFSLLQIGNTAGILYILLCGVHGTYICAFGLFVQYVNQFVIGAICLLPAIFFSWLGYYLGVKDKPILKSLGIQIKPPTPKKPRNK